MGCPKLIPRCSIIKSTPKAILQDLNEAEMCFSFKAYKASVIMCRRALENVCIDKGATSNSLYNEIKELADQGLITKDTVNIFEEIRLFGNYGAHPSNDLLGKVTRSNSESVLEVTTHIIKHIYDVPGKISKLTSKRNTRH